MYIGVQNERCLNLMQVEGNRIMKTAKEVTINYLESIRKDRENVLKMVKKDDLARVPLICDITYLEITTKLVEESEGE